MPADFSRIGVTAKLAAYYRRFSDIPFAAEAAELIGAAGALDALTREHGIDREKLNFYAPMFEARYKSIDALLRRSGARQVLELASGYSLRGLDLPRDGFRYVEADLGGVVETKRVLLDDLRHVHGIAPSADHVLTVADALDPDEVRAAAALLDPAQPAVVLCEGLLLYLSRGEIAQVASNVRAALDGFAGGCWITPDFTFAAEGRDLPPERARLREAVAGVTQRQLEAAAFEDADALVSFLAEAGFRTEVRSQVDETPSFASIAAFGLSPALIEQLRPRLKVWVLTPIR